MAFDLVVLEKDKEKSHSLVCQKLYFDSVGNDKVKGERLLSTGLQNTVAVSIIHKTTGYYKALSCTRMWSVYNCNERAEPALITACPPFTCYS